MPTYEYVCRDCAHHLEVVQSFRDAPLTTCGTCGGALRKVFSAAGIIFKGSGYYVTDSRAEKEKSGTKEASGTKEQTKEASGAKEPAKEASDAKGKGESPSAGSSTAKSA